MIAGTDKGLLKFEQFVTEKYPEKPFISEILLKNILPLNFELLLIIKALLEYVYELL